MSPFCHGGVTFSHHQDFLLRRSGAQTLDNSVTDAVVLLAHPRGSFSGGASCKRPARLTQTWRSYMTCSAASCVG